MAKTKYISATELREALGMSRDQAIRRIRSGQIKSERIGRAWAIPVTELERIPTTDWYKSMSKQATV